MLRIVISALIVAVLIPTAANAAPATNLEVSPAITEWLVAPGEAAQKEIIVTNTTKAPAPVSTLVRPFNLQEELRNPAAAGRYDASHWLSVGQADFILRAGQSRKVLVRLTVPKTAVPGGHYATIYFRQPRPAGSSGAEARIGALAFITVKGNITKKLEPGPVDAAWKNGDLTMSVTLRNTGNAHVMPDGEFAITNWQGNEVGKVAMAQGMSLPQTARVYQAVFTHAGYGIYTIKPHVSYGNQQVVLPSVTLWVFPWVEVAGGLALVAFIWFGVYKKRHRWKRALKALTHKSV